MWIASFAPLKWHFIIFCGRFGVSHTRILHLTARLHSTFNLIFRRSQSFLTSAAIKCPSTLVRNVYSVSATFSYTVTGYNSLYDASHLKHYSPATVLILSVNFVCVALPHRLQNSLSEPFHRTSKLHYSCFIFNCTFVGVCNI